MLAKVNSIIEHAGNREAFFRRIALFLPRSDPRYKDIERAYDAAKEAFRGKQRDDGERYFEHLRAVALILIEYLRITDHTLIIAALLHDIVEDIPSWTVQRVHRGFGERVAWLVDYATKPSKGEFPDGAERLHAYHARFDLAPREFFLIKLPDRLHNLLTLDGCPEEKRVRKIIETRKHYIRHAERQLILLHEIEAALEASEKERI